MPGWLERSADLLQRRLKPHITPPTSALQHNMLQKDTHIHSLY